MSLQAIRVWALRSLVAATMASAPSHVRAACPVHPSLGTSVAAASADAGTRLRFIRSQMEVGAHRSRIWAASWGAAYGASFVTQLALTPFVTEGTRINLYVGAASAFVGTLTRSIAVPRVIRERRRLARKMDAGEDECATLRFAERGMARSAKNEKFGRSLFLHLGAIVYNAGIGVVLGVALKRPFSAARQAAIGGTVGQIMIITQPTTMMHALDRYRGGDLSTKPPRYLRPLVLQGGGGVMWQGRF